MVQRQDAGVPVLRVLLCGRQLCQDVREVLGGRLQGDGLGVLLGVPEALVLLDGLHVLVVKAVQVKGLLDQPRGVVLGGEGVGLDDELLPVPVLRDHLLRDMGGGRGKDQGGQQGDGGDSPFHTLRHHPLHRAKAPPARGMAATTTARINLFFMMRYLH